MKEIKNRNFFGKNFTFKYFFGIKMIHRKYFRKYLPDSNLFFGIEQLIQFFSEESDGNFGFFSEIDKTDQLEYRYGRRDYLS